MEFKLVQQLSQKLVMTPQLQMAIKLLQLNRLELIDAVREELMGNPILEDAADVPDPGAAAAEASETPTVDRVAALEERRDAAPASPEERSAMEASTQEDYWEKFLDAYANQTPLPSQQRLNSDDMPSLEATLSSHSSLSDYLESQIRMTAFTEDEARFAMLVIHNLDDNGYLNLKGVVVDAPDKRAERKKERDREKARERAEEEGLDEEPEEDEPVLNEPGGDPEAVANATRELSIDDLPLASSGQMRIQFHLVGQGEAWIDDVRLYDLRFSKEQRYQISKRLYAAKTALEEGQLMDCQRLIDGYWPRLFVEQAPIANIAAKPTDVTPTSKGDAAGDEKGLSDRLRGIVPRILR